MLIISELKSKKNTKKITVFISSEMGKQQLKERRAKRSRKCETTTERGGQRLWGRKVY